MVLPVTTAATAASIASKRTATSMLTSATNSASSSSKKSPPPGLGRKSISSTRLTPTPIPTATAATRTRRKRSPLSYQQYNNSTSNSSSTRIRSSLLHKLGIEEQEATLVYKDLTLKKRKPKSLLGNVPILSEPLKYQADHDDNEDGCLDDERQEHSSSPAFWQFLGVGLPTATPTPCTTIKEETENDDESSHPNLSPSTSDSSMSTSASTRCSSSSGGGGIKFNENVAVIPIPKRDEYSDRVRDRLWCNVQELNRNVQRNTIEFAAEGWDWRTTIEDDGMYVCTESGEKIHPVHVEYQE